MSMKHYRSSGKARVLLNLLNDIAVIVDVTGQFLMVNDVFEEVTGLSHKELIGTPFLKLNIVTEESKMVLLENLKKRMQGAPVEPYEISFKDKAGETKQVEVKGKKITYAGQPANLVVFHDITSRKTNERLLKEYSEQMEALVKAKIKEVRDEAEKFVDLAENSPNMIFICQKGKVVYANKEAQRVMGYTKEEYYSSEFNFLDLIMPEDRKLVLSQFAKHTKGEEVAAYEYGLMTKDGRRIDALINSKLIEYCGTQAILGIVTDITELKSAELAVSRSEESFKVYVESSPVAVFVANPQGKYEYVNDAACKLLGYSKAELLEMSIPQIAFTSGGPPDLSEFEEVKRAGQSLSEQALKMKNGLPVYVILNSVRLPDGKLMAFCENITERKKADQQLRTLKDFEERIIDSLGESLLIIDPSDYRIISVNKVALEQLKLRKDDLIGKTCYEATHHRLTPCEAPEHICPMKEMLETGSSVTVEHTHIDHQNNEVNVEISAYPLTTPEGKKVVIHVEKDVTERKLMERVVHESEEKFRTISNSLKDALILVDDQGKIAFWNPSAQETFGYSQAEALGKEIQVLVSPETNKRVAESIRLGITKFAETGQHGVMDNPIEVTAQRKDGTEFPIRLSLSSMRLKDKWHGVALARDITEQKNLQKKLEEYTEGLELTVAERTKELKEANKRLLKAERFAAIGELAGMVGHDLRNPLQGIKSAAYYLNKNQNSILNDDSKKMFTVIDKAVEHADKIISDLQEYSKEIQLELENCLPRIILKEALSLIQVPARVKIDSKLEELVIRADKAKMQRVFINLIKNAIDAMPEGGTLEIRSTRTNGNVEISFADTGTGMSKETLAKLFTPLVTSKAQGMGFGLAICKRITEAHNGKISVQSVEGAGSTFTLTFPNEPELKTGGENEWQVIPESSLSMTTRT
jgi:two-component system sensor kinase FixL